MTRARLLARWVAANAVAELVGLGVAAGASVLLVRVLRTDDDPVRALAVALAMIVLGTGEGLAVGIAQYAALRPALPTLSGRRWTYATMAGAGIAWALGMLPSTLVAFLHPSASATDARPPSHWLVLLLAAGLGLVAGPILAAFQVRVLREHAPRAALWLPANAVAWALGMPLIFELVHVVATSDLGALAIPVVALGLAAVGAVVGLVHGVALVRLVPGSLRSLPGSGVARGDASRSPDSLDLRAEVR